jgi:hypothetical protein
MDAEEWLMEMVTVYLKQKLRFNLNTFAENAIMDLSELLMDNVLNAVVNKKDANALTLTS